MTASGNQRDGTAATAPLVGRERELALLNACLLHALGGRGGVVLIGGEAGIGKTSLAEAVSSAASARGLLVLAGRCFDLTDTPPYGPWTELFLRHHHDDGGPPGGMPPLPAAFAQRAGVGDVVSQASLFQQVEDFIVAVSHERPLMLLFDDLQWSDSASLDLFRVIARRATHLPLLLIGTYRGDELTPAHPLTSLLPLLVREAAAVRLNLHRLRISDVATFVTYRYSVPDADASRLGAYLYERSEGNPFFLGELARTLEEEGIVRPCQGGWDVGDLAHVHVPTLVRQVIDGRLARLGEDARALLGGAAVIGQEVPLALWQAIAAADEETVLDCIERATDACILAPSRDGTQVRFAHALTHEAVYESIAPARRRIRHRHVAEALMALHEEPPLDAVAYHLRRAGDPRAVAWLIRAAERAQHAHAWLTAAHRYEAALSLLETGPTDAGQRGWLRYRLAMLRRLSDPQTGIALLKEAEQLAAAANDTALATLALLYQGLLRCLAGDFSEGLPQLRRGLAALGEGADDRRALADGRDTLRHDVGQGTLVIWLAISGHAAEAHAANIYPDAQRRTRALAPRWPTPYGDGWWGLAWVAALEGRVEEARETFANAREAFLAVDYHYHVGVCTTTELLLCLLPYHTDDRPPLEDVAGIAERAFARASGEQDDITGRFARLPLLVLTGAWQEARAIAASVAARTNAHCVVKAIAAAALAPIACAQDDAATIRTLVEEWLPKGPETAPGTTVYVVSTLMQRIAATSAIAAADLTRARAWLEAHDRWLAWNGAALGRADGEALWAEYHRAAGDPTSARMHALQAVAEATAPRQPLALLAAHRLLGELDTEAGRHADAATHLDASLALADACAALYERALTLLALAELHARSGDGEVARSLLVDARALCGPLGARRALDRADALAATLAHDTAAPRHYPAGLTGREIEVLRLIVAGRTNREIADTLFLSRNTVMNHVAHILAKTNTDNRAAAVAFALRQGIA